ncbi:hypothetical protein QZH41_019470 [Actinostola sp. cb2023]|nr:hypothetical protein QZH41_019470 [Actinostola sp. cb2023]
MRPVPAAKIITEGSNHMAYQDGSRRDKPKPCRRKVMSSCYREKKTFERKGELDDKIESSTTPRLVASGVDILHLDPIYICMDGEVVCGPLNVRIEVWVFIDVHVNIAVGGHLELGFLQWEQDRLQKSLAVEAKAIMSYGLVQENSPGYKAGLEPFFDFIVSIENTRLDQDNESLKEILKSNAEKPVKMLVYSSKTLKVREVSITPSNMWGGQGLLGVSIRFCSFDGANENVWHVLDVQPNSPADIAGLRTNTDYIIGADSVLHEVILTPNSNWGGEGSLGCGIGYGYLHRIPQRDEEKPTSVTSHAAPSSDGFSEVPLTGVTTAMSTPLDQEMASLNLESTTAQAAMNPLNTSLISSTIAGAPYVPGASIVTGAPYTPGASTIGGTPYNPATSTLGSTPYNPATSTLGGTPYNPATSTLGGTLYNPATSTLGGTPYNPATSTLGGTPYNPATSTLGGTPYNPAASTLGGTPFNPATSTLSGTPYNPATSTLGGTPYNPATSTLGGTPYNPATSTLGGTPYNPATFNPAGPQTTAAPVPLFQTPTLVPTPVSSGQLPAHYPSTAGPAVPPMYSSPLIPAFSTATGVAPAPYTGSFASAAATAKPSPANISAAFSTPSQPPVSSFPGSTVTVTAKPFHLTTDITAGATPAPLTPVSSVSNGEDAAALQQTVSPQILAQ